MALPWKVYAIRAFMVLYVVGDVLIITAALVGAAMGESELAIVLMDYEGDIPNDIQAPLWGVAITVVLAAGYLYTVLRCFFSIDRLITAAYRGQLASFYAGQSMRNLGRWLVALWIALIVVETVAPLVLFAPVAEEGMVVFAPFDLKVILALVGMALWLTASLAEEAEAMKEELEGVV